MNDGVGEAYRDAFEEFMEQMGQTIIVYTNFNSPNASSYEVRGLKSTPPKQSSKVIFQFPDQLDVAVGTVLQVKGSRDYWRVTDTEDKVISDVFINFEAHVDKVNVSGVPTRPRVTGNTVYNLQGTHARVNIGSQDYSVNVSNQAIQNVFADLRQAIQTQVPSGEQKVVLLQKVEELEETKGTARFIDRYKEFVSLAADHIAVIGVFLPALSQLLGG